MATAVLSMIDPRLGLAAAAATSLASDPNGAYPLLAGLARAGGLSEGEAEHLLEVLSATTADNLTPLEQLLRQPRYQEAIRAGLPALLKLTAPPADDWRTLPGVCPDCGAMHPLEEHVLAFRQRYDARLVR